MDTCVCGWLRVKQPHILLSLVTHLVDSLSPERGHRRNLEEVVHQEEMRVCDGQSHQLSRQLQNLRQQHMKTEQLTLYT